MPTYIEPKWENKVAPCGGDEGCPAFTDIAASLHAVANRNYRLAWELMMLSHPLRSSLGRVCYSFCEAPCNRGEFDTPISIRELESLIGDKGYYPEYRPELAKRNGKKIAIIGSGPAGLVAGWYLNINGFSVTIYEKEKEAGGLLRYGIPSYRLPKDVLKKEVDLISASGVDIKTDSLVDISDPDKFCDKNGYDAMVIAVGASRENKIEFRGRDHAVSGLDVLKGINRGEYSSDSFSGKNVAIIGGGNVAMDVSRSAVRLGANKVTVVYRRTKDFMPAYHIEVEEAIEEGVLFDFLKSPYEYDGKKLKVENMHLNMLEGDGRGKIESTGECSELDVDLLLLATGQYPETRGKSYSNRIYLTGDAKEGSKGTVIHSIADAKKVAAALAYDLTSVEIFKPLGEIVDYDKMNVNRYFESRMRLRIQFAPAKERIKSFMEVTKIASEDEAVLEAMRCFRCGLCIGGLNSDCDWCFKACDDGSVEKLMIDWTPDKVLFSKKDGCNSCGKCWEDCPRYVVTPVEVVKE